MVNYTTKDVAKIAGITNRTLRHYHQTGVLPEPKRKDNGYRAYTMWHVARTFEIRRLAQYGVPLAEIRDILEKPTRSRKQELWSTYEKAKIEIDEQIEALSQKSAELDEIISNLRSKCNSDQGQVTSATEAVARDNWMIINLVQGVIGEKSQEVITPVIEMIESDCRLIELAEKFENINEDCTLSEINQMVSKMKININRILQTPELNRLSQVDVLPDIVEMLDGVTVETRLNEAQMQVLSQLREQIGTGTLETPPSNSEN